MVHLIYIVSVSTEALGDDALMPEDYVKINIRGGRVLSSEIISAGLPGVVMKDGSLMEVFEKETAELISSVMESHGCAMFSLRLFSGTFPAILWQQDDFWTLLALLSEHTPTLSPDQTAGISYKLKDQLSLFFGSLNLLSHSIKNRKFKSSDAYMALLTQNSYRLERLASNLIALTSAHVSPSFIYADIAAACRGIFESAEAHLGASGAQLRFNAPDKVLSTLFDQTALEHMLLNLISNAIKHNDTGVSVDVTVEATCENICITVADNGRGISADSLRACFDPSMETAYGTAKPAGLGLPLTNKLAKQHEGYLSLISYPGCTEAKIILPVKAPAPGMLQIRHAAVDYAGGLDHILIELSDVLPPEEFL